MVETKTKPASTPLIGEILRERLASTNAPKTCSPEQARLEVKIDSLSSDTLCTRTITQYRERIAAMSDDELKSTSNHLILSKLLKSYDAADLKETELFYTRNPTPKNRELFVSVLTESLVEAKNERILRFNQIRLEIKKHGTPEQMREFLTAARKDGIISKRQYDLLSARLEREGLEASAKAFNDQMYALAYSVGADLRSARNRVQDARQQIEGPRVQGTATIVPQFIERRSSTEYAATHAPRTDTSMTKFFTLLADSPLKLNLSVAEILKLTSEAIKRKVEDHKDEVTEDEQESVRKELDRVRAVLAKYPELTGEFQLDFAELEKLPEYAIDALARSLIAAHFPSRRNAAQETPNYDLPKAK